MAKKVAVKRWGGAFSFSICVWSVKELEDGFSLLKNLLFWFVSSHFFYVSLAYLKLNPH